LMKKSKKTLDLARDAIEMTKQDPLDVKLGDSGTTLYQEQRTRVHAALLAWYARHGRHELPWRHTHDPYAILVAEIMLQQTQVERVLPKYILFLEKFPTIAALAQAPTSEVIREWAGLGYNQRAVRLQKSARQVITTLSGKLPTTLAGLMTLPGIGRYTAGAIACFAFGLPVATVDTNIRRVLWRLFLGIESADWPGGDRSAREILALAGWALPVDSAYDWQQALMDLGATTCLGRRPLCESCPLTGCCRAYEQVSRMTLFPGGESFARFRRVAEEREGYSVAGRSDPHRSRKPIKQRESFGSSSRYFRGRIVEVLRALAPGESLLLAELGERVRPDFAAESSQLSSWLGGIVAGLERDGLVRLVEPAEDGVAPRQLVSSAITPDDLERVRVALP
jgi:A/G-specific adenine glycosylase